MSAFDDAFSVASSAFQETYGEEATFTAPGAEPVPISVVVDRNVHSMDNMSGAVSVSIELSWRIGSISNPKNGVFTITKTGEKFRPKELVSNDGCWITYGTMKA